MSVDKSRKRHCILFMVAIAIVLGQASSTVNPPDGPPPSSSGYVGFTDDNPSHPYDGVNVLNGLPPSSSSTHPEGQAHRGQPYDRVEKSPMIGHQYLSGTSGTLPILKAKPTMANCITEYYVAATDANRDHSDVPDCTPPSSSEYVAPTHNHVSQPYHGVDELDGESTSSSEYVAATPSIGANIIMEPTYPTVRHHHHQSASPPSSSEHAVTTHDQDSQPGCAIDIPAVPPPSSSENITTSHDQHSQSDDSIDIRAAPPPSSLENITTTHDQQSQDVIRILAALTPSLVSSINDSNHVAGLPNANNPIWQQIVNHRIGEIVMAVAAAVLSQYKDLTNLKAGWIAMVLLVGIAMIWNALLSHTMHRRLMPTVGMIGIALIFITLTGSTSSFFKSAKLSIIYWLTCAFMCLPLMRGLWYENVNLHMMELMYPMVRHHRHRSTTSPPPTTTATIQTYPMVRHHRHRSASPPSSSEYTTTTHDHHSQPGRAINIPTAPPPSSSENITTTHDQNSQPGHSIDRLAALPPSSLENITTTHNQPTYPMVRHYRHWSTPSPPPMTTTTIQMYPMVRHHRHQSASPPSSLEYATTIDDQHGQPGRAIDIPTTPPPSSENITTTHDQHSQPGHSIDIPTALPPSSLENINTTHNQLVYPMVRHYRHQTTPLSPPTTTTAIQMYPMVQHHHLQSALPPSSSEYAVTTHDQHS